MLNGDLNFRSVSRLHIGKVRKNNEDAIADLPRSGIWAVADGMGGHMAGERASALVADQLERLRPPDDAAQLVQLVSHCLEAVNEHLFNIGASNGVKYTMGTTALVMMVRQDHYACLWVGDSRLYLLREGELQQLTTDHSLLQEQFQKGEITEAEVKTSRLKNIITRALGVDQKVEIELVSDEIEPGDRFLLCTDGVSDLLPDDTVMGLIMDENIEKAADQLVDACLAAGAPDNLSVILVQAE